MELKQWIPPVYDPTENPLEVATKKNQTVIQPNKNQLLLDIDNEQQAQQFKSSLDFLMQQGIKASYKVTPSKTTGHLHITVDLDIDLSEPERVILQACLGSDPRREMYSFLRMRLQSSIVTVFFEPKKEPEPVSALSPEFLASVVDDIPF